MHVEFWNCKNWGITTGLKYFFKIYISELISVFVDDNIDETYGVNVQFESDEEVSFLFIIFFFYIFLSVHWQI